jgi:hypothetical protein
MNYADARRQTPGLQINNPGGMILCRCMKVSLQGNLPDRSILQVRILIGSLSIMYTLLCIGWSISARQDFLLTLEDFLMQIWAVFSHGG